MTGARLWIQGQPLQLWAVVAGLSFALSLGLTTWLVVRMPADTFAQPVALDRPYTWLQRLRQLARNCAGLLLVILGLLLSLPGVPGQGLMTVLLGLLLLDIPGKRAWELRLLRMTAVRKAIDRLRVRFGKQPLIIPEHPPVF